MCRWPARGVRSLECAANTATKCVAIGNRRHSFLPIIAGYFVRAAAIFVPGPRNVRFRIADFPRFSSPCGPTLRRRQAKLARSVGESPTQVMPSRQPGSECCVSRRRRRPRSVHSGCVGCVIEPRNGYVAGAETVQSVERNMDRAAKRGHARLPGSKSRSRAK